MLEFAIQHNIKEIYDLKDFITVTYILLIDDIHQKITPTHMNKSLRS